MLECGIFYTCFLFYHCPWLWLELKYINYFSFNPNQGGLASHDRIVSWGVICCKILVICGKCLSLWQFFFFFITNDRHKKNRRISILINGLCYLLSIYYSNIFVLRNTKILFRTLFFLCSFSLFLQNGKRRMWNLMPQALQRTTYADYYAYLVP